MKENVKSLLYFGLQDKICAKRRRWDIYSLPIYRCARRGITPNGRLQYYYAPVPEFYVGPDGYKGLASYSLPENQNRYRGRHEWRAEKLREYLQEAIERLKPDDYYLHPTVRRILGGDNDELPPLPLLEAMLYEKKGFPSLDIILPKDSRTGVTDTLISLLTPYLSRINTITVAGGEEGVYQELEEYFNEEYGIVVNRTKRAGKTNFVLNLWSGAEETRKFLDTMVKNGYNTKVN